MMIKWLKLETLNSKITAGFILIGLTTAMLSLFLTRSQAFSMVSQPATRSRTQASLSAYVESYYLANGSLDGVDQLFLTRDPMLHPPPVAIAVANLDNIILYGDPPFVIGEPLSNFSENLGPTWDVEVNGESVGRIVIGPPPETDPLQRNILDTLNTTTIIVIVLSLFLSLLIGWLLARTITRPLVDLTAASEKIASGDLLQSVASDSADEVGRLAQSFNKMSQDLSVAQAQRRQLTADLAHEIRTPLTVLLGYVEPLSEGRTEPSPEILQTIYHEIAYFGHLIDDLRLLSLAEAGELSLNKRSVDVRALFERTALAYMGTAEEKEIEIILEVADDIPLVEVDIQRMGQVLKNLVSNALRYTSPKGRILLSAKSTTTGVAMMIQDNGTGIAPDHLPHIFDRFYQVDRTEARQSGTSGLGLAIVKSIVEAHNGRIEVTSNAGTTFAIYL